MYLGVFSSFSSKNITPAVDLFQSLVLTTNINSHQGFIDFIKADPDAFGDPVFAAEVVRKLEASSNQGQYETMGKVTLAAKEGAKAIKAAMKKIG